MADAGRGRVAREIPRVAVKARHRGPRVVDGQTIPACPFKGDGSYLNCDCPKQLIWFKDGKPGKEAAPTDAKAALLSALQKEQEFAARANGNGQAHDNGQTLDTAPVLPVVAPAAPSPNGNGKTKLKDAIALFLQNKSEQTNELEERISLKHIEDKLRPLLEGKFLAFATQRNLVYLSDIRPPHILVFRKELKQNNGREYAVGSKRKLFHYLAEFFDFCVDTYDDLAKTPVTKAAKIKASSKAKKPKALTEAQFEQFHAVISKLNQDDNIKQKLPALLLLMFRTGLSLRDAVLLPRAAMRPNGSSKYWMVRTARAKTGSDVFCTIRAEIAEKILAGANADGDYLFVDSVPKGERALDSFIKKWGDRIKKLGKVANIQTAKGERLYPTSHWMRHSFVRWCLDHNISTENIAYMIGDTLAVVAEHYSEWIEGAQETLTATMKRAYEQNEKKAQAATAGQ